VRSAIITGVSRGLGAALFDELLAGGDRVLALGRRFTDAQHALERRDPARVRLRQTDLVHPATLPGPAELASFVHDATEVVLVHNAGVVDPVGAIGALPAEQISTSVAVNLTAPILLTNALLGAGLIRGGQGSAGTATRPVTILYVSSGAAHRVIGGWSVYSAAKRGAEAFFDALAAQYAEDGRVRVVNVNPGVMDTDMQARVRQHAAAGSYFPDRERFLGLHAAGQLVPPADIARRIVAEYLAARPAVPANLGRANLTGG
jgi:NAD(P)-dependent dehydrogenase (short-subunit alcohol dehydrogenase family)